MKKRAVRQTGKTEGKNRDTGRIRRKAEKRKLKRFLIAAATLMSFGAAAGAGYALFSAKGEAVENVFTIQAGLKGGEIENNEEKGTGVIETEWPKEDKDQNGIPDAAENLQPGSVVPKNPRFVSPLSYDAWAALKVEIPVAVFQTEGEEAPSVHECAELLELNKEKDWELLAEEKCVSEGGRSVYLFGYKERLSARAEGAEKGGETSVLFHGIKIPEDIISLEAETAGGAGFSGSIDVTPYAVQCEGYGSVRDAAPLFSEMAGLSGGEG